jgi:glycosyltransferase involved in cell wall biosynthesis
MIKVLVVGQLPPPFLGQPIMLAYLVHSQMPDVKLYHLPMQFSRDVSDVGRFRWFKLLRLFPLIMRIIYARIIWRPQILYFAPAAATKLSMFRDFAILIVSRFLFAKTVFHFHASGHSSLYTRLPSWQRWLFRRAYFGADAAIRISDLTPDDGQQLEARSEYIVPNGIEDPSAQKLVPAFRSSENGNPLRVLFVAMLYEAKGLLVLIDACAELTQRGVPFHLDVMGRFQSKEFELRVRDRIGQWRIKDSVCFLGHLSGREKLAAFAQANVLCHPTFHDTFPLVLLEAMACGMPVVATRVGGIPSIVDDNRTGFLVKPNDPVDVASRLAQLAEDRSLREQMGMAGREKFLREFSITQHIERMRKVFLDVAEAKR